MMPPRFYFIPILYLYSTENANIFSVFLKKLTRGKENFFEKKIFFPRTLILSKNFGKGEGFFSLMC